MDFLQLAQIFWKRRMWIVVTAILGAAVGFIGSFLISPAYRASTMILVEPQKVPSDYVKSTVTTTMSDRLKTIEQQITNRSNLAAIVEELELYPELMAQGETQAAVARARRDLAIQIRGQYIFEVFFKGQDRELVATVANRVAEAFIQENLKIREGQAQSTSEFLERELESTKAALESQEATVAQFRRRNEGSLPEQQMVTQGAIAQLERRLEIKEESIDQFQLRKLLLERGLLQGAPTENTSAPSQSDRLEMLRMQLLELRSTYTSKHPDVVRLESEIRQLEADMVAGGRRSSATIDPQVAAELEAVRQEIAQAEFDRDRILGEIEGVQRRLERTPSVEQRLLILNRDYSMTQDQHDSLLRKLTEARLAENLEKTKQSEQFEILEKAVPPRNAYWPNRKLLGAAGLAIGLFLGGALAWVREETDPTFMDLESLEKAFPGVVVMAGIPYISVATDDSGLVKLADDELIAGKESNRGLDSKSADSKRFA